MFKVTWQDFWLNARVADAIDIIILACLIGLLLQWWRRKRNPSVLIGSALLLVLYVAALTFDLYMTRTIMQTGLSVLLFGLIVIFQSDLRYALEHLLGWRPFQTKNLSADEKCIEAIVQATRLLASEKIGALLVFPGQQSIQRYCRAGTRVDAEVSVELLHSIFHPESQGHDGAAIIHGNRIDRLGVHLPLSIDPNKIKGLGTRHCAALGLAERTDAVILVVSEEKGSITLASQGDLFSVDNPVELQQQLGELLHKKASAADARGPASVPLERLGVGLVSLGLSALLWFLFAFEIQTIQQTVRSVPVEFHNLPEGWSIDGPYPDEVSLSLVGPKRAFNAFNTSELKAVVDLDSVDPRQTRVEITEQHLPLPDEIRIHRVEPPDLGFILTKVPAE